MYFHKFYFPPPKKQALANATNKKRPFYGPFFSLLSYIKLLFIGFSHPDHFGKGSYTLRGLRQPVIAHGLHSGHARCALYFFGRVALEYLMPDFVVHHQNFVDRHTPLITGVYA